MTYFHNEAHQCGDYCGDNYMSYTGYDCKFDNQAIDVSFCWPWHQDDFHNSSYPYRPQEQGVFLDSRFTFRRYGPITERTEDGHPLAYPVPASNMKQIQVAEVEKRSEATFQRSVEICPPPGLEHVRKPFEGAHSGLQDSPQLPGRCTLPSILGSFPKPDEHEKPVGREPAHLLEMSSLESESDVQGHSPKAEEGASEHQDTAGMRTLLLAYFPRKATEQELEEIFGVYGEITLLNLCKDKFGAPLCYGFLRFREAQAAEKAHDDCRDGHITMKDAGGKVWHLKASWAKTAFGKNGKSGKRFRVRYTQQAQARSWAPEPR